MTRRCSLFALALCMVSMQASAQQGGELHFSLRSEPKTFNPLLVTDEGAETIRYLTGGVLIRVNRSTQELQPELAVSWKILAGGRKIAFVRTPGAGGAPQWARDRRRARHHLSVAQLDVVQVARRHRYRRGVAARGSRSQ